MIEPNLPHPLPGETPDYRAARNALLQKEIALRALTAEVAETRRALPPGGAAPKDYAFTGTNGTVLLSQLFDGHDNLILYSLMYGPDADTPCPMCTSFLDSFNGTAPMLSQRCALAVVMSGSVEKGQALAKSRGWENLPVLSSTGTNYHDDYLSQTPDGSQLPMCNVFSRTGGTIRHFWGSEMLFADLKGQPRHIDTIWPLWNALDLLPEGRGTDWYPELGLEEG